MIHGWHRRWLSDESFLVEITYSERSTIKKRWLREGCVLLRKISICIIPSRLWSSLHWWWAAMSMLAWSNSTEIIISSTQSNWKSDSFFYFIFIHLANIDDEEETPSFPIINWEWTRVKICHCIENFIVISSISSFREVSRTRTWNNPLLLNKTSQHYQSFMIIRLSNGKIYCLAIDQNFHWISKKNFIQAAVH